MADLIEFLDIEDANPALVLSPIVRGLEKTFTYLGEHLEKVRSLFLLFVRGRETNVEAGVDLGTSEVTNLWLTYRRCRSVFGKHDPARKIGAFHILTGTIPDLHA
jgi:hypothetical protein